MTLDGAAPAKTSGGRLTGWLRLRNRLLSSTRFQRFAKSFPVTRLVARQRSRALFDLCAGFVYSQILLACVDLRLLDLLNDRSATVSELAEQCGLDETAMETLLKASAALELTERKRDGRYTLGAQGAALLGNPSVLAMIAHHRALYEDLQDPVALLRHQIEPTALSCVWAYATSERPSDLGWDSVASYTALMAKTQSLICEDLLAAFPLKTYRQLLDVGGGAGVFAGEAAQHNPSLNVMLFDLPAVAEHAQQRFDQMGLGGRARAVGGDFQRDPLPKGADIISLVRVLHDHDDETVRALLRAVREALPANGTVLVAEPMSQTRGAEPIGDAYFGFYLLAMGSGRPRTPDEYRSLLSAAGFRSMRLIRTRMPLLLRVIEARA